MSAVTISQLDNSSSNNNSNNYDDSSYCARTHLHSLFDQMAADPWSKPSQYFMGLKKLKIPINGFKWTATVMEQLN